MAEGNQKLWDKADADFRQAIKLDPKNSGAYLELGQLRLVQKKIPEAKTLLEQALPIPELGARPGPAGFDRHVQKQPAKAMSRVQAQIAKFRKTAICTTCWRSSNCNPAMPTERWRRLRRQ